MAAISPSKIEYVETLKNAIIEKVITENNEAEIFFESIPNEPLSFRVESTFIKSIEHLNQIFKPLSCPEWEINIQYFASSRKFLVYISPKISSENKSAVSPTRPSNVQIVDLGNTKSHNVDVDKFKEALPQAPSLPSVENYPDQLASTRSRFDRFPAGRLNHVNLSRLRVEPHHMRRNSSNSSISSVAFNTICPSSIACMTCSCSDCSSCGEKTCDQINACCNKLEPCLDLCGLICKACCACAKLIGELACSNED